MGGSAMNTTEGCWTCRVRRKKCDKHVPVCHVCSALLVTCHSNPKKPDWVDGGKRQQEMAEQLKQEVRDKAPYRRNLAYAEAMRAHIPDTARPPVLETSPIAMDIRGSSTGLPADPLGSPAGLAHMSLNHAICRFPAVSSMPSVFPQGHFATGEDLKHTAGSANMDLGLLVCYLDFYFPFLFPFYQPPMLDRGRAWVIELITVNQAMAQTTLSLSSYLFSLALETTNVEHGTCKRIAWEKLWGHIHSTFGLLQEQLPCLTDENVPEYLPRIVQIMGCVILLQRFETTVSSFENCYAHLNAAIELFKQALGCAERDSSLTTWASTFELVIHQLRGNQPQPSQLRTSRASNPEQMAFRFFSALLLVDDIVASTAVGEEPRLHRYHNSVLGNGQWPTENDAEPHILLDSVMGCQNWAIVAVAKISALDAWKKRQQAAGDFDVMEMVLRTRAIKDMLTTNLTRVGVTQYRVSSDLNNPWNPFSPWSGQSSLPAAQSLLVTRIWAHAAAIYLSVVVSGWQPTSSEIRNHVGRVIELLTQHTLSLAVLRTVAWPFCVAGCLAERAQEPLLREIVERLRSPALHGPVGKALEIMEYVWSIRTSLDPILWDLAACFSNSGHLVLLA